PANPDAADRWARGQNGRGSSLVTVSAGLNLRESTQSRSCRDMRVAAFHNERISMLRVILFLGTNLAIMLVLGIVVSLFGIDRWAYSHTGMNLQGMLVLCAVFGMGGAFISLAMSKWLAKMSVGAKVIDQPRSPDEQWLFATVRHHAEAAGIGMPEIAIY